MTKRFLPKDFFDLSSFRHRSLFFEDTSVWESLSNLFPYLEQLPLGKVCIDLPAHAFFAKQHLVFIGEGTVLQPTAYLEGPCYIGRQCMIGHGAYIRPGVVLGDGCVIGHGTEVKESILLDRVRLAHFNYVGNSILGHEVSGGAGAVCANFLLNQRQVSVRLKDGEIVTHLDKLGAIVGDGSQLGCNSVINPGVLLRKNTRCHPCSSWKRSNIPAD